MYKRISVMILSVAAIVFFGYALGGLGGYLFGSGKPLVAAGGFLGGLLSAYLALKIWKVYLDEIAKENEEIEKEKQQQV